MTTATCSTDAKGLGARDRLTTRSLHDDEIRAIADATYRSDNPLRFEGVRQAALLFERAGFRPVEVVSGVCDNTAQAMEDLRSTLKPARQIVRDRGMELFCAGTHPFARWSTC